MLIDKIRTRTDGVLEEEQYGFRKWRGCVDQLIVVRQLCEKFLVKEKNLFWFFMDLENSYDRVDRDALWQVMQLYGVCGKLLKAVHSYNVGIKACFKIGNELVNGSSLYILSLFKVAISPWLFTLYMDG